MRRSAGGAGQDFGFVLSACSDGGGGCSGGGASSHGARDHGMQRARAQDLAEQGIVIEGAELEALLPSWRHRTGMEKTAPRQESEGARQAMTQLEACLPLELG